MISFAVLTVIILLVAASHVVSLYFTSPEVLVKTRLVVTANTTLASVTPDTATFHFWTSIFEDLKEDEIEFTAAMQCTRVSGKVIEESKQYCF